MKIDVLTIFPEMIDGFIKESIIKRAIEKNLIEINLIDFRKYSKNIQKRVDDTPYGGGSGMVLMCQPIFDAVEDLNKMHDATIILMTPDGKTYNEDFAKSFSLKKHLIIICGHYEGFDERIRTLADYEISLGDFVLTGGEIPAAALIDSITRLVPGVISNGSLESESFTNNMLDYPVYTRPEEYEGMKVPSILLSGDHKKIDEWRKKEAFEKTKSRRKDLLEK